MVRGGIKCARLEDREAPGDKRSTKRRLKNRDAARKSRKKNTERADELHQELLSLEASNSALEKEIAALKKEVRRYTAALERHRPFCVLRRSSRVDVLEPSTSAPSKAEVVENPRPLPSSGYVSPRLFSLAPHSLFDGDSNTEFSNCVSSLLDCEDARSVTCGMFADEGRGAAQLEPHALNRNYESPSVSEQRDYNGALNPSQGIAPTLESLTEPLSVPAHLDTPDGFFPPNEPSMEPFLGELSLSEFLAENDWILGVAGDPDTL
ncbi:uncharacterized protein batf2 [Vanacampus margaritifer]